VYEADGVELLVTGEAAVGLTGDDAGGIIHAVGETTLAPGVIAQALKDQPVLIGDGGDGAQMVLVEACPREGGGSA
jgi:hypothetical protein